MLSDYLVTARRQAAELREALASGDALRVGAVAHKLKSSSRSVGALAFGDLCAELDAAGKAGNRALLARFAPQFEARFARIEKNIVDLVGTEGYRKDPT
ncbi:MAG: Hpt domain-containing protein [Burkholderiales bacterium]|nr:Hpt domain-containing protein [Burkholderiales bacterium]